MAIVEASGDADVVLVRGLLTRYRWSEHGWLCREWSDIQQLSGHQELSDGETAAGVVSMRLLIAMMKHETNTFSPVPTPLSRFGHAPGPIYGEAAVTAYRGTGSGLGAYIELAEREGAEIVMPIAAGAPPSREVEDAAFEHMAGAICDAVKQGGFDGIMLDLHGAMVTETYEDGEGELLRRIRAIDPQTPIAVSLDMHTNLYDAIIDNATVVAGYRTYPHIDTYDTAKRAGEILLQAMRGEVKPVMAWGNVPMLPHVMRQGSDDFPNKELQARCAAMSAPGADGGALSATLFVGFPHADIHNAGLSVVVVTDGNKALAAKLRDELLEQAWADREAFVYKLETLDDSLARAKAIEPPKPGEGPIVLLDHYDNCASGGTMDTTAVLAAIIREGLDNVAAFAIFDPDAVRQAIAAGIGASVTLSIGGKMAMPQIPGESKPLTVTGTVKTISNGRFRNKGPSSRGVQMDMGPSVVIDTGKVEIAVISRHVEPNDLNCFYTLGIDPMQKRYLMLKSRIHWRAGLGSLAKAVVECAGMGVCTSDYSQLTFKNVRRPIYPLDLPNR
ncbi:MAG TPA: M81 family metallopeptidase [Stellaceae bacterium]|jgi:microcystin degradation protein MlrC|nr:M81 family metallopeptidase [Stellaceae bacterium]